MKNSLLIFGTKNLNDSLGEIKDYLNFTLLFYDKFLFSDISIPTTSAVLIDSEICNDPDVLNIIKKIKNKPFLLLKKYKMSNVPNLDYDDVIILPLSLVEISDKIKNLITSRTYNQNSSIQIKEYVLDKNERKLKSNSLFVTLTEREIQLIQLLFNEKNPISKNIILKKIWKYAEDADTHTIETHIYRLRKKIFNKFKDEKFITNSKSGYSI